MSTQSDAAETRWLRGGADGIARAMLLVPEAPLIGALLCAYWALSESPLIGLLVTLLIVNFIARTLALLGARIALAKAHHRAAAGLAQAALALYPWSADAMALRGAIALADGRADEAAAAFRRALALLPGQSSLQAALGGALLAQGRPIEAAAAARAALALAPASALAHLYLAEADRANGAAAQDVEDRLRAGLAVAAAPEAEAALRCALGAHLLAQHRVAEATLTLHGAEALVPRCTPSHQIELRVRLGELLIAQGQIERAGEQFRSVAALDPHGRHSAAAWRASHLQ